MFNQATPKPKRSKAAKTHTLPEKRRRRAPLIKLIIASLFLSQLACQTLIPARSLATATMEPTPRSEVTETVTAAPTTAPTTLPKTNSVKLMCIGSQEYGATCLQDGIWSNYTRENSPIKSNLIIDIAACPDGRILFLSTSNIDTFDGYEWENYTGGWGYGSAKAVDCDAAGHFWVAYYGGVSHYAGQTWTNYPASEHLATTAEASDILEDIVVAPDGKVWAVTNSSIAVYADAEWKIYQDGAGFDRRYFFDRIAVTQDGTPWVTNGEGLFTYDGLFWTQFPNASIYTIKSIVADQQERLWIGSFSQGLFIFDGQKWNSYTHENSALASDHVSSLATDDAGRLWIGTNWGLNVLENNTWHTYRMDNAGLADNDIVALAVNSGSALSLPPLLEKAPGSLSGKILGEDDMPLASAAIEICVLKTYNTSAETSPCDQQPWVRNTQSDANGEFSFSDLPPGRYILAAETTDGWVKYGTSNNNNLRILIQPDQENDIGEISFAPSK